VLKRATAVDRSLRPRAGELHDSIALARGVLDAGSLVARGGRIVLEADEVRLAVGSQTLARGASGGGQVLAGGGWGGGGGWRQAREVTLAPGAQVDASATAQGDGGEAPTRKSNLSWHC
jgi:hypothetical protein